MYFVSKTLAEKGAWKFAEEKKIDFISVIPTLVVGPFLGSSFPPSLITALSPITGNEAHYSIIKQGHYVHLDDLCMAHIFLFEHPKGEGRYVCSSHDATIHEVADLFQRKYPQLNFPTMLIGVEEDIMKSSFSSKKLTDMGFEFKYSLEDMMVGAVESCTEKGLLSVCNGIKEADDLSG